MKIDLSKYKKLSKKQWEDKVVYRGLHIKYKYQLNDLKKLYPEKIGRLQDRYNLLQPFISKIDFKDYGKIVEIYGLDFCLNKYLTEIQPIIIEETEFLSNKVQRLIDKYATTLKEIELRDNKLVKRSPKGTIYYIDLTNGNDARTGLKIGESTIDSTSDTTHFIDDLLTGADDYINGSFVWNVTRSAGSLITDFVADTDTVTLATPIAGMTAGDTYYILDAWLTIQKYTSITSRSAGDIGKIRANTSQSGFTVADVVADEDGNADTFILIKGCDSSDDPWGDSSDVKPYFDFEANNYQFVWNGDHYWKFENLEFRNGTDYGLIRLSTSGAVGTIFEGCKFSGNGSYGIYWEGVGPGLIKDCEFINNSSWQILFSSYATSIFIIGCSLDGSGKGISYVPTTANSAKVRVIDCSFGQTTPLTDYDIYTDNLSSVYTRNCKWDKGIFSATAREYLDLIKRYEDDDQVFEAHKLVGYYGTVEKETTVVRPGGADSSAKLTPTDTIGENFPVGLSGLAYEGGERDFNIWLSADVEKTINIYIRGFGWTGFPTVLQLFIRASYYGNAGNCIRAQLVSDEVISDNTTWVPFQVTLTPARDGFVYVDVIVGHYEASSGVFVDIKPVVT